MWGRSSRGVSGQLTSFQGSCSARIRSTRAWSSRETTYWFSWASRTHLASENDGGRQEQGAEGEERLRPRVTGQVVDRDQHGEQGDGEGERPTGRRTRWWSSWRECECPCPEVSSRRDRPGIGTDTQLPATLPRVSSWSSPAAIAVEDRLFRALAVLRVSRPRQRGRAEHLPGRRLRAPDGRGGLRRRDGRCGPASPPGPTPSSGAVPSSSWPPTWLIAMALLAVTPYVNDADSTASLPGFWILGALFAWSIHYRWLGGLVAGALLAAADLQRQDVDAVRLRQRLPAGPGRHDRRLHVRVAAADGHRA